MNKKSWWFLYIGWFLSFFVTFSTSVFVFKTLVVLIDPASNLFILARQITIQQLLDLSFSSSVLLAFLALSTDLLIKDRHLISLLIIEIAFAIASSAFLSITGSHLIHFGRDINFNELKTFQVILACCLTPTWFLSRYLTPKIFQLLGRLLFRCMDPNVGGI